MSITGSNNPFSCEPVIFSANNRIVSLGTITRNGNQFIFSVGFVWNINGITYQNEVPYTLTILNATSGFNRIDNALLNTSNSIELQQGLESEAIALQPVVPDTAILLTSWNITGASIEEPSEPITGALYVAKGESIEQVINSSGVIGALDMSDLRSSVRFTGSVTELNSIQRNGFLRHGQPFYFKNDQATPITLGKLTSSGNVKFRGIHTLKPGEIMEFNFNWSAMRLELVGRTILDIENVNGLQAALDNKLDASAYNDHFKGKYTSLANLQSAHPISIDGDYAIVDAGLATEALQYIYDLDEGWVKGSSTAASTTDALTEGSTNLYFQTARVLATVLSGLSFVTGGAIVSTDTVLQAFGKIQKQINDLSTIYQAILTDSNFGSFVNGLASKTTPVDTDFDIIIDSADSNKAKKITWANRKATLRTLFDTLYASKFRIGSAINTSAVTGTTTITKVSGPILIPANTFLTGDSFTFRARLNRTVTVSSVSTVYFYTAPNTAVSVITDPTLVQISFYTASLTNTVVQGKSEVVVKNAANATELVAYTNSDDDVQGTDFRTRTNINWAVDQYVYVFIGNGQISTSAYVSFWELFKK